MPANRPSYLTNANRGASRNGMTTAMVAVIGDPCALGARTGKSPLHLASPPAGRNRHPPAGWCVPERVDEHAGEHLVQAAVAQGPPGEAGRAVSTDAATAKLSPVRLELDMQPAGGLPAVRGEGNDLLVVPGVRFFDDLPVADVEADVPGVAVADLGEDEVTGG